MAYGYLEQAHARKEDLLPTNSRQKKAQAADGRLGLKNA